MQLFLEVFSTVLHGAAILQQSSLLPFQLTRVCLFGSLLSAQLNVKLIEAVVQYTTRFFCVFYRWQLQLFPNSVDTFYRPHAIVPCVWHYSVVLYQFYISPLYPPTVHKNGTDWRPAVHHGARKPPSVVQLTFKLQLIRRSKKLP